MEISKQLASEFKVKVSQVEDTIKLIDEGNTIPFIARYRKEVTGGLSDVTLRDLSERLVYLRNLEERKEEVIRLIDEQGKLTDTLKEEILKAEVLQRVEDLYKPFKKKKETRASKAKERGLEPLAIRFLLQQEKTGDCATFAEEYINPELDVNSAEDAISGAKDIVAENISEDADLIKEIREITYEKGLIITSAVDSEAKSVYEMYYDAKEQIKKIPNHRVLAINRGEKEKFIKVKVEVPDNLIVDFLKEKIINGKSIYVEVLAEAIEDSYKRLIAPSVEREVRNILKERAEEEGIKIFAKNTEKLLMTPPVKNKNVISIDPGYRTGCKVAVLDKTGKLKAYTTIYPTKPKSDIEGSEKTLKKIVEKYNIDVIVIGNGTASRETEEVVSNFIKKNGYPLRYTIVNEAGASIYSASKLATEEYPDLDVTTRGAMSLGRRLQDPLSELVKIDPKHIGVGQYQHDMNQKKLDSALGAVVEDCVNRVGVDLNTASTSLLSYVSGINSSVAKNIVKYREEEGEFTSRKQLLKVSKLGEKAFKQCAGFLRISDAKEVLDSTSVHPESYNIAKALMEKVGVTQENIKQGGVKDLDQRINRACKTKELQSGLEILSKELNVGVMTLRDIVEELRKPARDPRDDAPEVIFKENIKSMEDLDIGMEVSGTVRNVVDFGAFVDIGVKQDALVHISRMSNKFIKHPMDVVSVGDNITATIVEIDKDKGRVGLSMI